MKKKKIILLGCTLMLICLVTIVTSHVFMSKDVDSAHDTLKSKGLSMMLETGRGTGEYELVTRSSWPSEGYVFNETLSRCENGGTLEWDSVNKTVKTHVTGSDKCYVYFDVEPPDIYITASNIPSTYGALGNVTCSSNGATYNQKYNRVEISSVNNYEECTLVYTDSTSKKNLASYVTSLAGTTQGTGQVVSETIAQMPDYSKVTTISSSSYTNVQMGNSTFMDGGLSTTSNLYTFSNNEWTLNTSLLATSQWSTIRFIPNVSGYYQLCFNLNQDSNDDELYISVNDEYLLDSWIDTDENTEKSGCVELGYVNNSYYIRIGLRPSSASSTTSSLSFKIQKANTVSNVNTGIRYEGTNPNNYVWFNNEYWRIIGVFNEDSHGIENTNLVKLIRENPIGYLSWGGDANDGWEDSNLNYLLNDVYINANDGTNSGYCYGYYNDIQSNCDYTKYGIQENYRDMIENVTWYLGEYSTSNTTASLLYEYERGTNVKKTHATSTMGYVGLIYPSDYGFSFLATDCARSTYYGKYYSACGNKSWLADSIRGSYTITHANYYSGTAYVFGTGGTIIASYGRGIHPVLYLKSSVDYVGGDGTMSNPYLLGM